MPIIRPTRRDILKIAAAAPAFSLPGAALARLGPPSGDNPAHYAFTMGDMSLTVVSDGYFTLPTDMFAINAPEGELDALLARHFLSQDQAYSHTNHLLIRQGENVVLVDVGSGHRFFDTAGRLVGHLDAMGVAPDDVTHVVITHAHPDHIWGIRDEFDEPPFPNAEYFIGQVEHDYWMQDGLVDRVDPSEQQFVAGAVNSIQADGVEWTFLADGDEVVPGVSVLMTPGHTPGHLSLRLSSGDDTLIALGDAMNHAWMNFAQPGWYNASDTDGPLAVETRGRLLDMAAADRMAVLGYHFPFPGVGHVMREGDAFRFVPSVWQFG